MQHHTLYKQTFIFTSWIVVKREILVLKPSQYEVCYNVTMVLVPQMAILAENYDVTMVLVLQMVSIGKKNSSQQVISAMDLIH